MSKPDFSSMSKEDIAAYYEDLLKKQEDSQSVVVTNLRKENSELKNKHENEINSIKDKIAEKENEIETINSDREKLKTHNRNLTDLIQNILDNIREHNNIYSKYLLDENIPSVDENSIKELNMYFEGLMVTLCNAVSALNKHQERSLSLGTSEKNTGSSSEGNQNYSADDKAQKDGKEELANAEAVNIDDHEKQDFNEQTETLIKSAANINAANVKKDELTPEQISAAIMSDGSENCKESIDDETEITTDIINAATDEFKNTDGDLLNRQHSRNEENYISVCNSDRVAGVITHAGETTFKMYCPVCGTVEFFKLLAKKKRINSVLTITDSLNSLGTVLSSVQLARCTKCEANVEINPASLTGISLTVPLEQSLNEPKTDNKQDLNATCTKETASDSHLSEVKDAGLDTQKTSAEQSLDTNNTRDEQKNRKELFNRIRNDLQASRTDLILSDHMVKANSGELPVIDPASFNAHVFGMTPAFIKSRLSVALLAACGTQFSQLGAPKNRTFNYFEGNGFPMSREHLTGAINSFARAYLHPVTELIRKEIIKNSSAVIMDESNILIRESAKRKMAEGQSRKSQIWTLNTNWTSDFKASWYCVSESRSAQNVIDILGDEVKEDDSTLKYLISDGYTGYDSALKALQSQGISIKSCRCYAHARRPLHYLLKDNGLIKIYNEHLLPSGALFSDFKENLKKYRGSKTGKKLKDSYADLLSIYWMINALFVIDSAVVRKHQFVCTTEEFKQELLKVRQEKSAKIVDAIFDSVKLFISKNPNIVNCRLNSKGELHFTQNKRYPESRALIYLLKYENDLRRFTESADIELSSNAAERSLKLGIVSRKAFMFIHSEDGANSFADFQTIINSCILNRVPAQHYMIWLIANIKWRMNRLICEGHADPTFFTMPGKKKNMATGKILPMYDERNRIGYDKVDMRGLTPYDYRKSLEIGLKI